MAIATSDTAAPVLPAAGTPDEHLKRASWAAACQPDQQQEQAGQVPAQDAIDSGTKPVSVLSSSVEERNQAPGILDRRKSTRPTLAAGSRSLSRNNNKSGRDTPPIRISMADIGGEMRSKDDTTPGNDSDTFEDAPNTPRPSSTEAVKEQDLATTGDTKEESLSGLTIDGVAETPQSRLEANNEATEHVNGSAGSGQGVTPAQNGALDNVPLIPQPESSSRDRSISPGTVPSRGQSPTKLRGLSGDLNVPITAPPSTAERAHALQERQVGERPGIAKKASSGFAGFLGRMGSIRKARSPPGPRQEGRFGAERRNTAASLGSFNSEQGGLTAIPDAPDGASAHKRTLQDQFKSLRQQEEHAHDRGDHHMLNGESKPVERSQSEQDITSSAKASEDGRQHWDRSLSTGGLKSPPLNPSLPPGTASGLTAGLPEEPRPVDWDLWQAVVYEGPAAVRRTSGTELREAIASGIPPAIRGVVWQVLAESKNEDLENIYRTLKARGTEAGQQLKPGPMLRSESQNALNGTHEKESVASSRSSVHSEASTPATSAIASPPPSVAEGTGSDLQVKLLAEKQKRESQTVAKLEKAIRRDMGSRTSYSKYTQSAGLQDGLFGICKAYALFDEGVGYAQGINFIAMPLLFNMAEEEAFTLLVRLMSKYNLRSMFTADMSGLHLRLYQFERLLEDLEPALYCHLKRRHVGPDLYATQWFLTLFAYRFPLQLVLRVYDLILSEGLTAILKFGIVLMQRNRETLLEMKDMSHLTTFLKEKLFDVYIDKTPSASSLLDSGFFGSVTGGADKELYRADEMVRDACEIVISEYSLASYTAEWEELQRLERERQEELETLRSTNQSLTARVKSLEERTQQHDTEHVSIAGDLVKLKVENDQLQDENEALKVKVEELQKLIDAQPAEVERKLKEEMDRIMQRNIEVQNENRALKEEAEEMEQDLVNAKMMHAQARADHDALQQKLASVQALLGGQ